jgi:hypothetical protein
MHEKGLKGLKGSEGLASLNGILKLVLATLAYPDIRSLKRRILATFLTVHKSTLIYTNLICKDL